MGKRGRIRREDVYSVGREPSDRVKSNVQLGHTRFDLIKKARLLYPSAIFSSLQKEVPHASTDPYTPAHESIPFYLKRKNFQRTIPLPLRVQTLPNLLSSLKIEKLYTRVTTRTSPFSVKSGRRSTTAEGTSSRPSIFSCCLSGRCPI